MNPPASHPGPPAPAPDSSAGYTPEVLAGITGITIQTILLYQEHGIIHPLSEAGPLFDDEAVRTLRRIEHLRDVCEMNLAGLKLLAGLLGEVEELRAELRARRQIP